MELDTITFHMIEQEINSIIANPSYEYVSQQVLHKLGLEPNIDSVLSFIMGYLLGLVEHYTLVQYHRRLTIKETQELFALLQKRLPEIKEACLHVHNVD